ncbi:hypothetical protein SPI_08064 [Niveomyces insectorum RCEF 264]|uniref:AB hydrolase-1 domain-containing protein n=1 Tax=Niveomyces insectorum RCEF 264 TaxID=1081102 RepID=A0A167NS58_9HYPO|nr:hypothetical protein SPI_08064 [Niveomyces insectorum RCEF 264]
MDNSKTQTRFVPHLGGIDVGHRLSQTPLDPAKPTVVLYNPFTATAAYYEPEFSNAALCAAVNLVAVEPLGHGKTRALKTETYTYWDTAAMTLQLLDALGVDKFFALGTSQGGWMTVRAALLAPERVLGVIPVGSSMDYESEHSRAIGCWDGPGNTAGFVNQAGATAADLDPNFVPGDGYCDFLMHIGFGKHLTPAIRAAWDASLRANYHGPAGQRRIIMAAMALSTRDSLHARLPGVRCPVLWLQGTDDIVFSMQQAEEDLPRFTHAPEKRLVRCEGGVHFLSATHAEKLHAELLAFVKKWSGRRTCGPEKL